MKIAAPGIFRDFPIDAYFLDPCPAPSLTQSLAKILLDRSPLHAYQACPSLNVQAVQEDDVEKYEKNLAIGNAAHALMLHRGKSIQIADFDDWRSKEAKAVKSDALKNGREPILAKHFEIAQEMAHAANEQLAHIHGCENAFTNGDAEVVIANCEDDIWLRSMLDWVSPDLREVYDLKTSGMSASPYATGKLMASAGWHLQAAFHERILDEIDPKNAGRRKHYFVAQENTAPFALTVNLISEAAMTIGRKQVDYAIKAWSHCLRKGVWPAYPPKIITPELPAWNENAWLGREMDEAAEHDPDLIFAG